MPGHLGDLINNYLEILLWKLTKLMSVQVTVTSGVAKESPKSFMKLE